MALMAGLSLWLKQIIAAVLLASLVELLLPNRTMHRYVRLVAGLFILLTVITPVLSWIKGDFGSKLANGMQAWESTRPTSAGGLSQIKAQAQELQKRRSGDAAELVASRLREAIKADVERSEKRPVRTVDVGLEQQADGTLAVQSVVITLEGGGSQPVADVPASSPPIAEVKPVAPVTVDIAPDSRPAAKTGDAASPDPQTTKRIAAFIALRYGVPADLVQVKQTDSIGR